MADKLKAPFPWFGGKSRCAAQVWQALGDVGNYVEPFAGSLAVLLARPTPPDLETVNDADCYLANFWRSVQLDPDSVAAYADWPVNEADLHARHAWLIDQIEFRERMKSDPDFYYPKIAGWWIWGICAWIGQGWCKSKAIQIPHLADLGRGVHSVSRQIPHLGTHGNGVHSLSVTGAGIAETINALRARLRRVRVTCGDWTRVMSNSVLYTPIHKRTQKNITGVFLDPPYQDGVIEYAAGKGISSKVRDWAIEHGDNPKLRIVLCGYDGEHKMPQSWRVISRVENGGYGNQSGNTNRKRERLWLSPSCLSATDGAGQ